MADIVLTGLASNDPVPGVYLEINFGQGPAGASSSPREILLIGNKLTGGTAVESTQVYGPDTPDALQTEDNAKALFGDGGELHLLWREVARVNKDSVIRAIVAPEGVSATAATGTITYATVASGNGYTRVWVDEEFIDVPILTGDTVTAIATAVAAAINGKSSWPVTAGSAAGIVTITSKNKGLRQNFHRYMAKVIGSVGTTVTPTTDSALTGGTVVDQLTTVLSTIATARYYYVVSAPNDASQLTAIMAQLNAQALPTSGIRQRLFAATTDILSTSNTLATGANTVRLELIWSQENPIGPARLAAKCAAIYALEELAANPRTNFVGYGSDANTQTKWGVPAPRNSSARPSRTSIKSALLNGLTPIGVNANGSTYIVNRVTTRTLNGSTPDYRSSRAHKVSICDFFADDLISKTVLQFSGKRIGDDPKKGARAPGPEVVTPLIYRGAVLRLIDDYDGNDLLQNVTDIKSQTVVQRESANRTRMGVRIPLQPIDNCEQFAIAIDQVA
jgi:phage tail sheath gpL-like